MNVHFRASGLADTTTTQTGKPESTLVIQRWRRRSSCSVWGQLSLSPYQRSSSSPPTGPENPLFVRATAPATASDSGVGVRRRLANRRGYLCSLMPMFFQSGSAFRLVCVFFGYGLNWEVLSACSSLQSSTWIVIWCVFVFFFFQFAVELFCWVAFVLQIAQWKPFSWIAFELFDVRRMLYSNDVFCWSVLLMVLLVAGCSFVDGGVCIFFFL